MLGGSEETEINYDDALKIEKDGWLMRDRCYDKYMISI